MNELGRIIFDRSLQPCPGHGTSMGEEAVLADSGRAGEIAAGVGRVRRTTFLSTLRESSALGDGFGFLFGCSPLNAALSE